MTPSLPGRRLATVLALAGLTAHSLGAQSAPTASPATTCDAPSSIVGDRPGNLFGPVLLPVHAVQAEVGLSRSTGGGATTLTGGATLLRVGVACAAELRFGFNGLQSVSNPVGNRVIGASDAFIGTKVRLRRGSGATPTVAVLAGASLPTSARYSRTSVEPEIALSAMWDLPHAHTLTGYVGEAARRSGNVTVAERVTAASYGVPVGRGFSSFVEYSEYVRPGSAARFAAIGGTLVPGSRLQLDATAYMPINMPGAGPILAAGVSRRW
jgi:hypothetical protein